MVVPIDPSRRGAVRRRAKRRQVLAVALLAMAAVMVVVAVGSVFSVIDAASRPPAAGPAVVSVGHGVDASAGTVLVVQSGDTLTSIARRLQPTGDVHPLVARLASMHGPAPLQPGERLDIGSLGYRLDR